MRTTENFGFQIPEEDEFFDIGYVAHNMDILDEEVKNIKDAPINDEAPTYEEATELTKLSSGEKLSIALGKIAKAVSKVISHIETAATSSILGHVKVTTGNGLSNSSGNISMSKGTGTDYGAIKLSDKYNSKVTNGAAANSIGASQNALYEAYNEITNNLTNEDNEKFVFGVKDGVRGFYTNPSRADDSFIPFSSSNPYNFNDETLLWTSPLAANKRPGAFNVSLDLKKYRLVRISFRNGENDTNTFYNFYFHTDGVQGIAYINNCWFSHRFVTATKNQVSFTVAYEYDGVEDKWLFPYQIYGIK